MSNYIKQLRSFVVLSHFLTSAQPVSLDAYYSALWLVLTRTTPLVSSKEYRCSAYRELLQSVL